MIRLRPLEDRIAAAETWQEGRICLRKVAADYDRLEAELLEELLGSFLHAGAFHPAKRSEGLGLSAGDAVLEVACGTGFTACFLASAFGCNVTATNISARQLAKSAERASRSDLSHRVKLACCDYHHLPFVNGGFDLWWCQEALLLAVDRQLVLREAGRVLKPGGLLVFSDLTLQVATPEARRQRLLGRVGAATMWDMPDYQHALARLGYEIMRFDDWSGQLVLTYAAMKQRVEAGSGVLLKGLGQARVSRILDDLDAWVDAAQAGDLGWLYVVARKAV